ncbi:hypothetical protein AQUCO_06900064v1 [Aquilegia coerulea]|uniref:Uncharacterized protein n=1 Tax=Aquilegia coerulea TaxID=218851 RepID=A0A2G5CB94_AQUCA|nr:hypothetical protein AQUCO_06900064v1 [Aquilegia coerulea]
MLLLCLVSCQFEYCLFLGLVEWTFVFKWCIKFGYIDSGFSLEMIGSINRGLVLFGLSVRHTLYRSR